MHARLTQARGYRGVLVPVPVPVPDPELEPEPNPEPLGLLLEPPVLLPAAPVPLPDDPPAPMAPVRSSCRAICESAMARPASCTAASLEAPGDWLRMELMDSRSLSEARSSRWTGSLDAIGDAEDEGEAVLLLPRGEVADGVLPLLPEGEVADGVLPEGEEADEAPLAPVDEPAPMVDEPVLEEPAPVVLGLLMAPGVDVPVLVPVADGRLLGVDGVELLAPEAAGVLLLLASVEGEVEGLCAVARPVASPREIANRVGFNCMETSFRGGGETRRTRTQAHRAGIDPAGNRCGAGGCL